MSKFSEEAYIVLHDALDISSSFKVYGDGREQHIKEVEEARQELEAIGTY